MEAALSPDMLATDLAYYLVRKGVSSASGSRMLAKMAKDMGDGNRKAW